MQGTAILNVTVWIPRLMAYSLWAAAQPRHLEFYTSGLSATLFVTCWSWCGQIERFTWLVVAHNCEQSNVLLVAFKVTTTQLLVAWFGPNSITFFQLLMPALPLFFCQCS